MEPTLLCSEAGALTAALDGSEKEMAQYPMSRRLAIYTSSL
jgi:hypothetical protein